MTDPATAVVVETNVVSYMFDERGPVEYYVDQLLGKNLLISFQTLEEIQFGALKRDWGAQRTSEMEEHLQQYEVIWPNPEVVAISAQMRNARERAGRRLTTADAWMASTALLLDCPLASYDGDFNDISGLKLIRPLY